MLAYVGNEVHEKQQAHDGGKAVGVDDVQLAPVLSLFPPLRGPDVLCALLLMPSAAELQSIGLQGLVVDDHWRCVHVTISLETEAPCQFKAHLYIAGVGVRRPPRTSTVCSVSAVA
jgi:hypothetical protein